MPYDTRAPARRGGRPASSTAPSSSSSTSDRSTSSYDRAPSATGRSSYPKKSGGYSNGGYTQNSGDSESRRPPRRTNRTDDRPARRDSVDLDAPRHDSLADVVVDEGNGFAASGLPERLVKALAKQGLTEPFAIQTAAIPDALTGRDLLGRAETGSGKTLAFGLPMIARLVDKRANARRPLAVIVLPTRELAMQVTDALKPYVFAMNLRLRLIAGGMPYNKQIDALDRGVEILVATPGRLIDLMDQGVCDLSEVEIIVLDEADQMCDMGFAPAMARILDETPKGGQRMLFSATLDGDVDRLVRRYLIDPVRHSTAAVNSTITTMEHHLFVVHPSDKQRVTAELAAGDGRSIVFVRTKLGADRVAAELRGHGVRAAALHGGLGQGARTRTLAAFKDGEVPVLVATDVAARGLHVDGVGLVIQADMPTDHKTYTHRAGRTARAGGSGSVVTLAMPRERRPAEKLVRDAGVNVKPTYVQPGHARLLDLAGGAVPSDERVEEYIAPSPASRRPAGAYRNRSARPSRRY